jgi:hypothetical protein
MEPIASRSTLNRFSERLATEPQQTIIEEIKQFSEATIHAVAQHDGGCDETDALRILVFNMERAYIYRKQSISSNMFRTPAVRCNSCQ